MKYRWLYFLFSALVLLPGIYHLVRFGLRPAIDFTGGSLVELKLEKTAANEELAGIVREQSIEVGSIQSSGPNTYILKLKPISAEQNRLLTEKIQEKYGVVQQLRYETVGPTLGQELLQKTFVAAAIAVSLILAYVAWAFKNVRFGVAAVLALLHDVLVVIGIFAILGKVLGVEVDALFVTAVLTTMSFSVHDTIVVFDRIREIQRKSSALPFEQIVNQALMETMGRSLNNSLTIIFMLLALFLMGGETVRWFVLALLIGTISGTYSSPFVATPIIYQWHVLRKKTS